MQKALELSASANADVGNNLQPRHTEKLPKVPILANISASCPLSVTLDFLQIPPFCGITTTSQCELVISCAEIKTRVFTEYVA